MITKEEYKDWAGITDDSQDAKIDEGIAMMEAMVQNYCDRMFDYAPNVTDEIDYPAGVLMVLSHYPIEAVTTVKVNGTETEDYRVRKAQGQIESDRFRNVDHIEVNYSGGFPAIPEDLRMVMFNLVESYLATGGDISAGAKSVTVFDFAKVDYGEQGPPDLIKPWERVLAFYRRAAV